MNIYKLRYQHYKDIVDDNILTVFVLAKMKKKLNIREKVSYAVERYYKSLKKNTKRKAKDEHFGLEHAENYLD